MKSNDFKKETLIIAHEHIEAFKSLYPKDFKRLVIDIIYTYNQGNEVDLKNMPSHLKTHFLYIQPNMDRMYKKWIEKCEKNRENGKKGGRPTKTKKQTIGLINNPSIANGLKESDSLFENPIKDYTNTINNSIRNNTKFRGRKEIIDQPINYEEDYKLATKIQIDESFTINFEDPMFRAYCNLPLKLIEGVENFIVKTKKGQFIEKIWIVKQIRDFAKNQGISN